MTQRPRSTLSSTSSPSRKPSAGRHHASGAVAAGGTDTADFVVPANDITPDTLDFWYAADRIDVSITPPSGAASAAVNRGTTTTLPLPNGNRVFVDSVLNHPNNGANRIYVQLQAGTAPAVRQGTWTVTLAGTSIVNGGWHAWIERGRTVPQFIGAHRNDLATISIPGTSTEVITAASYITKGAGVGNLSTFASRGPTRDGRAAPTIAAPGQQILPPTLGRAPRPHTVHRHVGHKHGAPHVAGAVALPPSRTQPAAILQASPVLTQQQIIGRLTNNARSDAFTGSVPNTDWGAGKLDADAT